MALGELKFGIRDNSRETSKMEIHTGAITATSLPGLLTQVGAMRAAIEGVTLGVMSSESLAVFETKLSALAPTTPLAQRGVKWTVGYSDTTEFVDGGAGGTNFPNPGFGKLFTFNIATADLSLLDSGEELLDLTTNPGLAFVTAFEAMARSPYGGNVNVEYVRYVD